MRLKKSKHVHAFDRRNRGAVVGARAWREARMAMRRALHVAEKPSVAKELARIMSGGRPQERAGCSRYNKLFEFAGRLDGQDCAMVVTSVLGHSSGPAH